MLAMELAEEGESVVTAMREDGVLINCTDQNSLRILPPLNVTQDQVDAGLAVLRRALAARSQAVGQPVAVR